MPTINLRRPLAAAYVVPEAQAPVPDEGGRTESALPEPPSAAPSPPAPDQDRAPAPQTEELARLLVTLNGIAARLGQLHEQTVARHRVEIARLAVEIARKILMHKIGKGDYDIQAIVEEALRESPTRQNIVIHLNPEDLVPCQELQRQNPQCPFAGLELTADQGLGRGECLVETPKGIVKSFLEEHLERISEALQRAQ